MTYNIFVVGMGDFNRKIIERIDDGRDYKFHRLLPEKFVHKPARYDIEEMIRVGKQELDEFDGEVHGIIGHWDFPVTSLLPVFREHCGLGGPALEDVLITENKYWVRVLSQEVIPNCTPEFQAVNPFDENALEDMRLTYPFWLKPTVSFSSQLSFFIENPEDFNNALETTRKQIGRFGEPFAKFMEIADLSEHSQDFPLEVDGYWCIAEKPIEGRQTTAEGYIKDGEGEVYGLVDSYRGGKLNSSFTRFQIPSTLPKPVKDRIERKCFKIINKIGLNNTPFNMETFYDEENDKLAFLEMNSRISQSHSPQFEHLAGMTHHKVAIDIALDEKPDFSIKDGKHGVSAKFMLRRYEDGEVLRTPTDEEVKEIEKKYPGTFIKIEVNEGDRLSDLTWQDPYSFILAAVYTGADNISELEKKYEAIEAELNFQFA